MREDPSWDPGAVVDGANPAPTKGDRGVAGLRADRRTFDGTNGRRCEIDATANSRARHRDESGVRVIKSPKLMGFLSGSSRRPLLENPASTGSLCRLPADPPTLRRGARDSRW